MRGVLAGLAVAVVLLAGCTANGVKSPVPPPVPVAVLLNSLEGYVDPFLMGHDHSDASLHQLAFHARQLDHHPLGGNALKSSGAHALDVRGSWLFAAAYGFAVDVDGGAYIFDLADPEHPTLTGHFPLLGNVGGDRSLEATEDANWIVLGTETIDCANHVNPTPPGLFLIDARDKANPKLADFAPSLPGLSGLVGGVHSVAVHRVAGKDYVVSLGAGPNNIRSIDPAAGKFQTVGSVPVGHDMAIYDDPILGIPILYVADVTDLNVYDFSDPAHLKKLGTWTPPDNKNHYVHAIAMDLVEGHRILAVESEDWQDQPSPVWMLDATDFGALQHIGTWSNSAGAPANAKENGPSLAFSTHNPRLEGGVLYLAHYHGGVWILDVRTLAKAAAPEIMGYLVPHEDNGGYRPQSSQSALPLPADPSCFGGFQIAELPNVMDVEVHNGLVYAADLHTGVYALRYDSSVTSAP